MASYAMEIKTMSLAHVQQKALIFPLNISLEEEDILLL